MKLALALILSLAATSAQASTYFCMADGHTVVLNEEALTVNVDGSTYRVTGQNYNDIGFLYTAVGAAIEVQIDLQMGNHATINGAHLELTCR
ncbi:MAG: hypothetical protein EOP11_01215 [Proteobacteria bacterium]|nr:MAG: hypothetical protein EOP11_01215 [Pseudomonadota bacterium]